MKKKMYKFIIGENGIGLTSDKIFADFMNKNLTWFQKFILWFR